MTPRGHLLAEPGLDTEVILGSELVMIRVSASEGWGLKSAAGVGRIRFVRWVFDHGPALGV